MFQKRIIAATTIAGVALLAFSACGGDDEPSTNGGGRATPPQDTSEATLELQPQPEVNQDLDEDVTAPSDGTIEVAAQNTAFSPNRLSIPLGGEVTIRLTNNDTVAHNLRIAGLDGQYDTEDDAVTDPETIAGDDTGNLTGFNPPVAGDYSFRCDFHPGSMGGQIEVE